MKIRYRLALQFTIIIACILLVFSIGIYIFSVNYRTNEFCSRIKYRAISVANMLHDINEVNAALLEKINRKILNHLYNENVEIFNLKGELIYEFRKNPENPKNWKTVDLKEIKEKGEVLKKVGNRDIVDFLYPANDPHLIVKASAIDEYGLSQLYNLKLILIAGFIISLCIAALSSIFYATEALSPISNIINKMGLIKASQLNMRLDVNKRKDEIDMLAVQFNQMLDRLEKSFEMQRSYVANISHEMRTPLTSINGQIEVSLLNKRNSEEYEEVLKSIHTDIINLITISNGFLELAETSIDNKLPKLSCIRVDEILCLATNEIKKRHPDFVIDINFDDTLDDENKLIIMGNFYLIKIIFINLMDNAYKFSDDKKLTIKLFTINNIISVEFIDNGIGIPINETEYVTQPFYRANNTDGRKGTGVGLAIVSKIVKMHNGTIKIVSEVNKGTNIMISMPVHC